MASVLAVRPDVNFLFILACLASLAFFGVNVRDPFLVTPAFCPALVAGFGLPGFLTSPCAMTIRYAGLQAGFGYLVFAEVCVCVCVWHPPMMDQGSVGMIDRLVCRGKVR